MKNAWNLRLLGLSLAVACHAADGQPTGPSEQADMQQQGIWAERDAALLRHEQEAKVCYQRFAVSDCLIQSRMRLRALLDDLKRQETALRDADRKRRAVEAERRVRDKSAEPASVGSP